MTGAADIDTAVQRQLLAIALRNSARSAVLLIAAVLIITLLGFQNGQPAAAWSVLLLGLGVSAWRLQLQHRFGQTDTLDAGAMRSALHQLEANAFVVGLMWIVATTRVYPTLSGNMDEIGRASCRERV